MKKIFLFIALFIGLAATAQRFPTGYLNVPMTTAEMNAISAPQIGRVIFNSDTQSEWAYTTSGWIDLGSTAGAGDVTAALPFVTDNRLIRSDGTGKGVQSSGWSLSDADDMTAGGELFMNGNPITSASGLTVTGTSTMGLTTFSGDVTVNSNFRVGGLGNTGVELRYFPTAYPSGHVGDIYVNKETGDLYWNSNYGDVSDPKMFAFSTGGTALESSDIDTFLELDAIVADKALGDVVGPASVADNSVARFDGTTGKLVQSSGVTIDDSGNLTLGGNKIGTNATDNSVFWGYLAGSNDDATANRSTGVGVSALREQTTGTDNSAFGQGALQGLTTGFRNLGIGTNTVSKITTTSDNVGIGHTAGSFTNAGSDATGVGRGVYIGSFASALSATSTNEIVIGYDAEGNGSNTVTIGNSSVTDNYFSGNITATGDLTVTGGDINSATSLDINLDTDNNGTESFNIVDGAGTTVFSVSEAGALTMSEFAVTADSIVAPNLTTTEIDNASPASLITKEWFNINNTAASTAADISIADAGGYYVGTTVEAALQEVPAFLISPADIGASDKTLASTDWGKFNYTDDSVVLTVDNSAAVGSRAVFQPTNVDSVLTFVPSAGVSFIGNGTALITDGFQVDSLNTASLIKLASNMFSVSGFVKPYTTEAVPVIEAFTNNWLNSASASISVNKPTGTTTGDLIVILVGMDRVDAAAGQWSASEAPSGFTFLATAGDATTDVHVAAYYKVSDGTEGASFTVGTVSPTEDLWAACLRISGVNTTTPIGVTGTATNTGAAASSISPTEITTVNANSLIIAFAGTDGSDMNYTGVTGTGWTLGEAIEGASSVDDSNGVWVYKNQPTAGLTGSPTISYSTSDGISGFMFSINPN